MPTVKLLSITPNYMETLKIACSKPYGSTITPAAIQRILESGHLSVLEHCYASFEVKCSVRVLGQLTRHRHLSFTCKSARGSKFDTMVIPDFILSAVKFHNPEISERDIIEQIEAESLGFYKGTLAQEEFSEQDAAYFLPQGIQTDLVVTGNFRAWFEYLPKRLCRRAMPEHRELARQIQQELAKVAPEIFDRNFMNCEGCKERSCEFK